MQFMIVVVVVFTACIQVAVANDAPQAVVTWPNGDRLSGQLVSQSDGVITLATPTVGQVKVASAGVTLTVIDAPDPAPEDDAAASVPDAAQDAAPELSEEDDSPWTGSLSFSATTSRAVNTVSNVRLAGTLKRADDAGKFDLSGAWFWNEDNDGTTDNDILVRGSQEWYVSETKWLYFAQATWQYNQFENWGHRVSPYGGVGYKWYDDDDLSVTLKGGGGLTWQYQTDMTTPQLLFEVNSSWKINDRQSLTGLVSIAPDPVDWGNYLATIKADWKLKLGSDTAWALSLGVRSIYDSRATGGNDANDLKAYAGLTMDF